MHMAYFQVIVAFVVLLCYVNGKAHARKAYKDQQCFKWNWDDLVNVCFPRKHT